MVCAPAATIADVIWVLLPPSEGKTPGGDGPGWEPESGAFPELAGHRVRVANALRRSKGGTKKSLGADGALLKRSKAANLAVLGGPTMPAWQRFSGVVWEALGPADLPARARRRAETGVLVVSAVAGLSAWSDPVPDFRLKLSVAVPPIGRLAAFWQQPLTQVLNDRVEGATVVDLLPNEHRAAWTADPSRYDLVRPLLATRDAKPAGHAGKATKGRLARALLESGDVERTLATFDPGELTLTIG